MRLRVGIGHPGNKNLVQKYVLSKFIRKEYNTINQLINLVGKVNPKTVYTVHGFTNQFAADLRREGITAWSLFKSDQLELFDKPSKS